MIRRRRALLGNNKVLPNEYQQVEYIESHGTEYIDTKILPNNLTGYSVKLSCNDITTDSFIFGAYENTWRFTVGVNSYWYVGFSAVYNYTDRWKATSGIPVTIKTNYKNDRIASVNDITNPQMLSSFLPTFTKNSIVLFGRMSGGSVKGHEQKLYACNITQGDKIIRCFVPCYRKSDTTIGMYDIIGQKFYTNDGTGTFTKGQDI